MTRHWRLPLLVLGFIALAFGLAGGLARLTVLPVSPNAIALHGPLMVSAFFGTVISLERAVALDRPWAYAAPLCAGAGGVCLLLSFPVAGFALMAAGAGGLVIASAVALTRQRSLERAALLGGAAAWLAGNLTVFFGLAAVPWWIAFFALTIGGERLALSHGLERGAAARSTFMILAAALLVAPLQPRLLGVVLVLLALWLFVFDRARARVTVRQSKLPRYVAVCLLAGDFWLGLSGALMALAIGYDATLHAIFVGFVFSMLFGHAPVMLPAVLRMTFHYHRILYLPLALLHASLVMRVFFSTQIGAWGNAAAIVLFVVTAASLVMLKRRDQSKEGQPP